MQKQLSQYRELLKTFPSLIPLKGKKPIEEGWEKWCEEKREFMPQYFQNKNAGLPCGPANGILVIDVDDINEFNQFLKEKKWDLPKTRMHMTGSGKPHYIYQYPENGKRYGCRSLKDSGFDVRGTGGQIVAPGSIHPDTGKPYTIRHDLPIAPAPQWLLDLAVKQEIPQDIRQGEMWDGDLTSLPVSLGIKKLIREGEPKGQRSEAIMSVVNALVGSNISEQVIFSIFEKYPIGEKYREKGRVRGKWLQSHIEKAREFKSTAKDKGRKPKFLSVMDMEREFGKQIEMLYKDIIPKGNPCIFAGDPGAGKSSNVAQISKEIVNANPDYWVLWVATEGFVSDHTDKWRKLKIPSRVVMLSDDNGVYKLRLDQWKDQEFLDQSLEALRQETNEKPIAVVIDSIRGMQSLGENDPKMASIMSAINSIVCDKHKAACIYIAHHKKGKESIRLNKVAGGTGITSSVRAVYTVERVSNFVCRIIPDKSNTLGYTPKNYKSILVEDEDGGFEIIIAEDVNANESDKSKAEKFLISLFKEKSEYLANEIRELGAIEELSLAIIKKAKTNLPIRSYQKEIGKSWFWQWESKESPRETNPLIKENPSPWGKNEKTASKKINNINEGDERDENFDNFPRGTRETRETRGNLKNECLSRNNNNVNTNLDTHTQEYIKGEL